MFMPERILLADPDPSASTGLADALQDATRARIVTLDAFPAVLTALREESWDLLICEMRWPENDCLDLLGPSAGRSSPVPVFLTSDQASASEVARLMAAGALDFFEKRGLGPAALQCLQRAPDSHEVCRRAARHLLGRLDLKEAQWRLRAEMSVAALTRVDGSRRAAANLLGVDRRYVQRMVNEFATVGEWSELIRWTH